jgi:sialidase-1
MYLIPTLLAFGDDFRAAEGKSGFGDKPPDKMVLFEQDKYGYNNCRIPSLIVTKKGTVLAFCEGREDRDTGDIDLLVRRSEDSGKTWGERLVVWSDGRNTCGNPCPVVDQDTGRIWLLATWNFGADHGPDIVRGESKDVRKPHVCYSDDDGKTWSTPVNISETARKDDWRWYATGPGNGIQILNGRYKGRLVIPANHSYTETRDDVFRMSGKYGYGAHVIYSDDHGKSWKLSESITPGCNESTVVELSDSRLMMNMRSYNGKKCRAISFSSDGGATWSPIEHHQTLIEPVCQASLISHNRDDKNLLIFSNPATQTDRFNLTVRVSKDDGKTWPIARQVHAGPAGYSSIAVLPDGNLGCFYEAGIGDGGDSDEIMYFKVISMESLLNDEAKKTLTIYRKSKFRQVAIRKGYHAKSGENAVVTVNDDLAALSQE